MQTYVIFILVVSVIIFLYILYLAFFNTSISNLINEPVNFKNSKKGLLFDPSGISGIGSAYFSISTWVYVKKRASQQHTIYSFIDQISGAKIENTTYTTEKVSTSSTAVGMCPANNNIPSWSKEINCPDSSSYKPRLALILDSESASPNLYLFYMYDLPNLKGTPILITNNFPLQKWTNVIVSFENQTLDVYIDGKLILSTSKLGYFDPSTGSFQEKTFVGNTTTTQILFGGDSIPTDISVTRAAYMPFVMDPQLAMRIYNMGSGVTDNEYKIDLKLFKNNSVVRDIQLY